MIFAEIRYNGDYDAHHELLCKILEEHFGDVQHGLQCDSWIQVRKNGEQVNVDSFTSMKHEVKATSIENKLVDEVIEVLKSSYTLNVHTPPTAEAHE